MVTFVLQYQNSKIRGGGYYYAIVCGENRTVLDYPLTPSTSLIYNSIVNHSEISIGGRYNTTAYYNTNRTSATDASTFTDLMNTPTLLPN